MIDSFIEHIQVDKNIVPLLSRSTYHRNFPYAIREIVSNAYDADALTVRIIMNKNLTKIQIEDDGNGMTVSEFKNFITIAGKKNTKGVSKKYKRKRIGYFGIGFLAIFPFCEELVITTKTENSDDVIVATIPTINFFDIDEAKLVEDIPVYVKVLNNREDRLKHYTKVELLRPTYYLKNYFKPSNTKKRDTIFALDQFDRFKWDLQDDLPISYEESNPITEFLRYKEPTSLNVFLNNDKLYRNNLPQIILEKGTEELKGINFKYVFTTNYDSIKPFEARGIKRRVNNVGIDRTDFNLKRDRGFSRLHWISGEVHFDSSITEFLNLSRDGFVSNNITDTIEDFLAEKLRTQAYKVEDIAEAERDLKNMMNDLKNKKVISREIILSSNLNKLKKAGFEIEDVTDKKNIKLNNDFFQIDKHRKKVLIRDLEKLKEEYFVIYDKKYQLEYSNWDLESGQPACKIQGNIIELNERYPFFKSKTYGNLFKKLHILLAISLKESKNKNEFYSNVMSAIETEFKEFL